MNCFPCFSSQKNKKETQDSSYDDVVQSKLPANIEATNQVSQENLPIQTFNFRELAAATRNFRQECLLGEGGFGKVYKGTLQATGQVVAVKQLDWNAMQENREFLSEVGQLCQLQHPNLINLIGYCADGDQRLLVYEYMPGGAIPDHLFDLKPDKKPLDWTTRMKIAYGAAQALEYLHDKANPPVIYSDLKSVNVLVDEQYNPKLSDIGLAKLGPAADSKMPMQSRVMGTYGYSAPEYSRSGLLTTTADVYSFGVVLLELITGRKAIDTNKPVDEQNLVTWAQPIFREPKKFPDMADPLLRRLFPERGLNQAVAIAAMCLQDESAARPLMSDVVTALSFLSMATEEDSIPKTLPPSISSKLHCISTKLQMQFMEPEEGKLMKKEQSAVMSVREEKEEEEEEEDTDSESDEDEDDDEVQNSQQRSVSSSQSSSTVSKDEKGASTRNFSRISTNDGSAYSIEESSKDADASSEEETSWTRNANYVSDSMNHRYSSKKSRDTSFSSDSRKLPYSSSNKNSGKSMGKHADLRNSSSSDSDESDSSDHRKRSSRKLQDERNSVSQKGSTESQHGNAPLPSHSSKKFSEAGSVSRSNNKSSLNSEDGNDHAENNSSRVVVIDENVSTNRKSSKESKDGNVPKSRKNNKKSSRDDNSKKSPDESASETRKSGKKKRLSKKADSSPDSIISSDGIEPLHHRKSTSPLAEKSSTSPVTLSKASTVNF